MRLQGLSSVIAAAISAALVGGAVATAQDPQTALEAVPAPVSSAAPSPFLAAAELPSLPMRVAAVDVARNEDRELTFDPFSAPTPEIAPLEGPRIPDPPPPSAPPTISAEPSIGSLGDLVDDPGAGAGPRRGARAGARPNVGGRARADGGAEPHRLTLRRRAGRPRRGSTSAA